MKRLISVLSAAAILIAATLSASAENDLILVHTGAYNARVTGYNDCGGRLDLYSYDLTQDVITEIGD